MKNPNVEPRPNPGKPAWRKPEVRRVALNDTAVLGPLIGGFDFGVHS